MILNVTVPKINNIGSRTDKTQFYKGHDGFPFIDNIKMYHNFFSMGGGGDRAGPIFFQGRSNSLFPIETHIICVFPSGS